MKVKLTKPPNWKRLEEAFGVSWDSGVLVTYGDTIHTKSRGGVSPDLIIHEGVHVKQQESIGPEKWWERYIADPQFRLQQEMEAYTKQCNYIRVAFRNDPSKVLRLFNHIWRSMSDMYGGMITYQEAKNALPIEPNRNPTLFQKT